MGEGWHYFATRLDGDGGEELLTPDLPLADVQITRALSGVDALDATIPVEVPRLRGADLSLFEPHYNTVVYAELGGVIRGAGIVTGAPVDEPKITVSGDGFRGFLDGLPFTGDKAYVQADPLDIARDIWASVQSQPGGNLGLQLSIDPSSSPVRLGTKSDDDVSFEAGPWTLYWWDTLDLGSRWDDLASAGGFDYYESHAWDGERIRHTLHVGWPMIGRRRDDLRFVVGENVTAPPSVEVDGAAYASEIVVLGAGEGRDMIRASWPITPRTGLYRPKVVTDKAIKSKSAAQARAQQEAAAYAGDQDVKQLVVSNHPNAPLGSWGLGDVITVQGSGTGWTGGLNMSVRILSWTISPDKGDDATLTVTRSDRVPASSGGSPVSTGPISQGV